MSKDTTDPRNWQLATRLVRGGTARSENGETSEAIFMTSGFCYDSAEAAEARFKNELPGFVRSEEHTSELQSLMRISYAVFCLKKKKHTTCRRTTTFYTKICRSIEQPIQQEHHLQPSRMNS